MRISLKVDIMHIQADCNMQAKGEHEFQEDQQKNCNEPQHVTWPNV
jgi:hypothetical protein